MIFTANGQRLSHHPYRITWCSSIQDREIRGRLESYFCTTYYVEKWDDRNAVWFDAFLVTVKDAVFPKGTEWLAIRRKWWPRQEVHTSLLDRMDPNRQHRYQ